MLIQNYGLFWKRRDVFWGRGSNAGHLKGVPARNKTADPVDFREQQGVYVLYDENYRLVYVGQVGANDKHRLFNRLHQHQTDHLADRWTKFSWFGVRWIKKSSNELAQEASGLQSKIGGVLNHIEAILISAAEPPHNRQGGRFGEEVHQFLQYRDRAALGLNEVEMLEALCKQLKVGHVA